MWHICNMYIVPLFGITRNFNGTEQIKNEKNKHMKTVPLKNMKQAMKNSFYALSFL